MYYLGIFLANEPFTDFDVLYIVGFGLLSTSLISMSLFETETDRNK